MRRDLDALANGRFDVAIIGGGMMGAAIARDAARRGLAVALVEAGDFGAGTPDISAYYIDGGMDWLARGRLPHVRTTLRERAAWMRIAPHQVEGQTWMTPIYGSGFLHLPGRSLGLSMLTRTFNWLSGDHARRGEEQWTTRIGGSAAALREPILDQDSEWGRLRGALVHHECGVDEPERLVLSLLKDAAAQGAEIANHLECIGLSLRNGRVNGIKVRDTLTDARWTLSAMSCVNATGSAVGDFASRLHPSQQEAKPPRAHRVCFATDAVPVSHAVRLVDGPFTTAILPWRGVSLVGTIGATGNDLSAEQLVQQISRVLPSVSGDLDPGRWQYSSSRPAIAAIADHQRDGISCMLSAYGSRWAGARLLAEKAVDALASLLNVRTRPCDTAHTPLLGAPLMPIQDFREEWRDRLGAWPLEDADAWISAYGSELQDVLALLPDIDGSDQGARERARFTYALTEEMAVTPGDIGRRLCRWYDIWHPGVAYRAAEWLDGRY